jgi:lactate permease
MIAPQSIAIGTATCGLVGKDGEVLGKIAKYAFGYLVVMAIFIYVGVLLGIHIA